MSTIKPLAPRRCPRCHAENTLFFDDDRQLTCNLCGYKDKEAPDASPKASEETFKRAQKYTVSYGLDYIGIVDTWTRAVYHTGLDHVRREEYDEAIKSFHRAIDSQRDFVDAHLWIARLSNDPETKRDHYSEVVAQMPNHQEAIRELMVLNGQLTPDESARAADASRDPERIKPQAPVKAQLAEQGCPNCGGTLEADWTGTQAVCQSCGYGKAVDEETARKGYGLESVSMALLKQRGKVIVWEVGEHLWHCNNCGADQILMGDMSRLCPFCGSSHVIEMDALESFQQPDSILPFRLSADQARDNLNNALSSRMERFKGIFVNNKVAQASLQATFVPIWYFDATLEVNRTTISKNTYHRDTKQTRRETFSEMAHDVPVPGVDSPARYLIQRIHDYDLGAVKPYTSQLIAGYHAQLYTRDFERAMMLARKQVGEQIRRRHSKTTQPETEVRVSTLFQQMFFRLILIPIYNFTLIEDDGDVRPAIVNGQTGKTALGRAEKVS